MAAGCHNHAIANHASGSWCLPTHIVTSLWPWSWSPSVCCWLMSEGELVGLVLGGRRGGWRNSADRGKECKQIMVWVYGTILYISIYVKYCFTSIIRQGWWISTLMCVTLADYLQNVLTWCIQVAGNILGVRNQCMEAASSEGIYQSGRFNNICRFSHSGGLFLINIWHFYEELAWKHDQCIIHEN